MEISIFDFTDYRIYLEKLSKTPHRGGYGFRTKIARAIRCQNAYVSRIFQGTSNLSLEQADDLSDFLGHSEEEREYFLLLVLKSRAGSKKLGGFYEKQIRRILDGRLQLRIRVKEMLPLSKEQQAIYYSNWLYAALHIMISIPGSHDRESLSRRLNLSPIKIAEALKFLVHSGILEQTHQGLRPGKRRIHLSGTSPYVGQHHTNWRLKAIRSLETDSTSDLHYTSIASLSREDFLKCKAQILTLIESYNATIAPSKDEIPAAFTIDWFQI